MMSLVLKKIIYLNRKNPKSILRNQKRMILHKWRLKNLKKLVTIFFEAICLSFLAEPNVDDMDEEELLRRAQELSLQDAEPSSQEGYQAGYINEF